MTNVRPSHWAAVLLAAFSTAPAFAVDITPSGDLRAAIAALKPGEELVLAGGSYNLNSRFGVTVVGTEAQPIVMRAKTGERAIINMTTDQQNIIEITSSRYFVVRAIEFTGGSHGIRLVDSDFVTIEDCAIHDTGDVALSANSGGTYEGLKILRNHIHHTNGTGEGMYLGCNNNDCRVANSLIANNYIHHTNGPTVAQGDGIELKEGSYGNIIRDNVIHDTNYPGILTYSAVGNGPANVVEGNLVWNSNDNAIQASADVIIRNNIVLDGPIALQNHQAGSPSNIQIVNNTIITEGTGIEVRNVVGAVLIANNAIYSQSGTAIQLLSGNLGLVTVAGNVGHGGLQGASSGFTEGKGIATDFVNAHYGVPPIDVFPKAGSALIGSAAATHVPATDFNGTARSGANDVGAYRYSANGNPGWTLAAGFKGGTRPNPPTNVTAQ